MDDVVKTKNFNILAWWKASSSKYPIVSKIARDVLSILISAVESESAFSTGGRVLNSYRSYLSPKIVEALICTQQWIRSPSKEFKLEDMLEEVQKIEQVEEGITKYYPKKKDGTAMNLPMIGIWVIMPLLTFWNMLL